ncbi:hypothetical protein D3C87_1239990 [compost metagenome]
MKINPSQTNKLILLGVSAILMVAFQNCSEVNFADKDPALFSLESNDPEAPVVMEPPANDDAPDAEEPVSDDDAPVNVVECELVSSKQKIILSDVLQIGSNASATRVCMSEHACLQLINAYSAKRDCQLSAGASSLAASESQCTRIFPGSKGTCRNATVISDEKVAQILEAMGK